MRSTPHRISCSPTHHERRPCSGEVMSRFDDWIESRTRAAAHRASRRGFLSALGGALFGGAVAVPLLPVARAQSARQPGPDESKLSGEAADPTSCNYWRYCGIDGFLSACCGGTPTMCPP